MPKGKYILWTKEELKFIKDNSKLLRKDLLAKFNKKFNKNVQLGAITGLCTRKRWLTGRLNGCSAPGYVHPTKGKKGFKGANRTSFKKGHVPMNKKKLVTKD